jgi:uncharacterized cupredoxin-like copper-binding protein
MSKIRVAILGVVAVALLAWAMPALAHNSKATATVNVKAGSPSPFSFTLSSKTAKHGVVTFVVKNEGQLPHDFKIAGKQTKLLQPGTSQTLKVTFNKAGSYPYLCTVSGHAAAGMKGALRVT